MYHPDLHSPIHSQLPTPLHSIQNLHMTLLQRRDLQECMQPPLSQEGGDIESVSEDPKAMWLDSGSTGHIVCSRDVMVNRTASTVSNVLAAGGESDEVTCCGQIHLQCTTGIEVGLTDVLCVPSFHVNFVSETQLMSRGVSIYKFNDKVSLTDDGGDVFLRGTVEDGRIRLQCKVATP
jgi:hypothetical protein